MLGQQSVSVSPYWKNLRMGWGVAGRAIINFRNKLIMDFCLCFYSLCCFILFVDVSLCVVRVNLDLCFTERWHLARSRLGTGTSPSVAPPLMLFIESFLDLIPFSFTNNIFYYYHR